MDEVSIRRATAADIPAVRTVIARSLAADPMLEWIFPPDTTNRESRLAIYFSAQVERLVTLGVTHMAMEGDAAVGAALWMPPGTGRPDSLPIGAELTEILCGADRSHTIGADFAAARAGAPDHDGPYLATLGVLPSHRGQGLGRRLLDAGHDCLGPTTWLESVNPANLGVYQRAGYAITHQAPFANGTTTLTLLKRG